MELCRFQLDDVPAAQRAAHSSVVMLKVFRGPLAGRVRLCCCAGGSPCLGRAGAWRFLPCTALGRLSKQRQPTRRRLALPLGRQPLRVGLTRAPCRWQPLPLLQWDIQAIGHVGAGDASCYDPIDRWILEGLNARPQGPRRQ